MNDLINFESDIEIVAKVKFNDGHAVVLSRKIKFTYYKFRTCIIGVDGCFFKVFYHDLPSKGFYAFGGSKFDLTMHDGEVVHCYGQYWDGYNNESRSIITEDSVHCTFGMEESLRECFVFTGCSVLKDQYNLLLSKYKGVFYEYDDYEHIIKSHKPHAKLIKILERSAYDKSMKVMDSNNDVFSVKQILGKTYYKYMYNEKPSSK